MSWLDTITSLYNSHTDVTGKPASFRDIIFCDFIYYLPIIEGLRVLDRNTPGYEAEKKKLKSKLACFALNLLKTRTGEIINRSGLIQFDFDHAGIKNYDTGELMQALFDLPFIAFCGRSCSGDGFYALAMIAEPEKQVQYVEHCFDVFLKYGIPPDTTKGRNVNDLRYVSYDAEMLYRDQPKPLRIKRFNAPKIISKPSVVHSSTKFFSSNSGLINWAIQQIQNAQIGQRFETVRKVSFTMGGHGLGLDEIKHAINYSSQYAGVETKYLRHADECFMAGKLKPIAA